MRTRTRTDHLVYTGLSGELAQSRCLSANMALLQSRNSCKPGIWIGKTEKNAGLALLFARMGAKCFHFLKHSEESNTIDRAREFIENWEVESYREQVAS